MEEGNFFAGSNLDREAEKRNNHDYIENLAEKETTQVILLSAMNPIAKVLTSDGIERYEAACIKFPNFMQILGNDCKQNQRREFLKRLLNDGNLIFLGSKNARSYFALDVSDLENKLFSNGFLTDNTKVLKSRIDILKLGNFEAALVAQSRSMLDWNKRYKFCPTCGSKTTAEDAGYKRKCVNDECLSNKGIYNTSYPRTDPVVISAVISADGQSMLLGRKKAFPPTMYSCLAGFMEPGETIEEAVRREVMEESGVIIGEVKYVSSQPWPYPSVLMIGCISTAESEEIIVCEEELEDARWFNITDIERSLKTGSDFPLIPPRQTIAHQLIKNVLQTPKL